MGAEHLRFIMKICWEIATLPCSQLIPAVTPLSGFAFESPWSGWKHLLLHLLQSIPWSSRCQGQMCLFRNACVKRWKPALFKWFLGRSKPLQEALRYLRWLLVVFRHSLTFTNDSFSQSIPKQQQSSFPSILSVCYIFLPLCKERIKGSWSYSITIATTMLLMQLIILICYIKYRKSTRNLLIYFSINYKGIIKKNEAILSVVSAFTQFYPIYCQREFFDSY